MTDQWVDAFEGERAEGYDRQFEKLFAFGEFMRLAARIALGDLPADARVLCVGVGTGTEIVSLAQERPGWRFLGVDPSASMLGVAQRKLLAAGLSERVELKEGYVEDVAQGAEFDGATALLVSHFLTERPERVRFFSEIRRRLKPNARLFFADISPDPDPAIRDLEVEAWLGMLAYSGMDEEMRAAWKEKFGVAFAAHDSADVEHIVAEAGFAAPFRLMQSILVRGWVAKAGP